MSIKKDIKVGMRIKVIILLSVITISVIGISFYFINKPKVSPNGTGVSGYIIGNGVEPGLTNEEIQALLNKEIDESKMAFSLYTEPTFKGKLGTIMFSNPRYNAHEIDLVVTAGGKDIIKTGRILPDQFIEEVELLTRPLKKGKHNALATVKAYKTGTDTLVGETVIDLIITSE